MARRVSKNKKNWKETGVRPSQLTDIFLYVKGANPPEERRASIRLTLVSSRQIGTVLPEQEVSVRIQNQKNSMKTLIYIGQESRVDLAPLYSEI